MKRSKIIKTISGKKKLIVVILLLILIFTLYKSDNVMIELPKKISSFTKAKANIDIFPLWSKITNNLFRFEDELNFFRIKRNLFDGKLPIYNLQLSSNDLKHFDNLSESGRANGYLDSEDNRWRSAKVDLNGEKYKVKVKLHGDALLQWSDESKSYKVKSESEEYINNMRQFNLILFEDRLINGRVTRLLAQEFGLMDIRDDVVVLKINGVVQGLYYLHEALDYDFLEYNQCSNCEIIKIRDNIFEDHPFHRGGGLFLSNSHISPFDYEVSNIDLTKSKLDTRKVLNSVNNLFQDINENNPKEVIGHFDIEQLSSFEALRMIIGDPKLISGDNLRLAYSSVNSKFYPLPINENIIELEKVNGGFEHNLNKYGNQFSRLFYLLTQDDDLRYLRNKKVYQFVIENEISGDIEKQITQYLPYALSYKTNNYNTRYINYQLKSMKKAIEHNLKAIKSNFKYSKAYVNVIGEGNTITMDLIPDSIAEIKFNELKMHLLDEYSGSISIVYDNGDDSSSKYSMVFRNTSRIIDLGEFMEDFYFSVGLDEDLNPKKRTYRFEISFDAEEKVLIENLTIKMRNDITGIEIDVDDVYVQIIDSNEYYDVPEVFLMDEFGKKYPTLNLAYNDETERLTLLKGDYILEKDLIIPRINAFIMEAGVNVLMGKNKSILSYSPVNVEGSRSEPVVIRSLVKDKPFGTFAILGEGKEKSKSTIDWLDISGGNEKWINGVYFSGQLSIYHVDVNINNVAVHGGHADDGLIVKYSYVVIDNSDFYDNVADQADLDFVFGVVKNSDFKGSKEGKGGDNLDLSGSRILIRNNKFSQSTDKGISIGEETEALLYKNTFSNNNVSVAVKDLSKVYFVENSFSNNNIAINSYQKKPLFGGSFSYIYDNDYISNGKDFSTDEKSKIYKINLTNNQYSTLVNNAENDIVTFPKVKG